MVKIRENEDTFSQPPNLSELMTCLEETIGDAQTINSALMLTMEMEQLEDLNHELLQQISFRMKEAQGLVRKAYYVSREM